MRFSEFLNKFYERGKNIISGYKSKKKITEFFIDKCHGEQYDQSIIDVSETSFERWFTGERNPSNSFWEALNKDFNEDKLQKELNLSLNNDYLNLLIQRFDITIQTGERPDKLALAKSIAAQFKAIAFGMGAAENITPSEYRQPPKLSGYNIYLRESVRKYKYLKFPGGEEALLDDYYVCNNIGRSSVAIARRTKVKYIENATLSKIRNHDSRGDSLYSIIIGSCGYGKSILLQHLFLEAVEHIDSTGILPIIGKLRNYSSIKGDLVDFLAQSVYEFDRDFCKEELINLLEKGQVAILFDGLDEMDNNETKVFQNNLSILCHHYPNNQIVISSRQCSGIDGIRGFVRLYIHPLSQEQVKELIDKLLQTEDDSVREKVISHFNSPSSYIKTESFIATNPMLLSLVITNHDCLSKPKTEFYELLYNTLTVNHDIEKESYDRLFYSVANSDEFTIAFREFCGMAYVDGVDKFNIREFRKYFSKLKCKSSFENPSKFSESQFRQDVCATSCMMYEQETEMLYIDNGFQDYFFADYYYCLDDSDDLKLMGRSLWNRDIDSFRNINALMMLYSFAPEKVKTLIILPYLESIFKGKSEKEALLYFLSLGYGFVNYTLFEKPTIDKHIENNAKFDCTLTQNHICNIVMGLICEIYNLPNTFVMGSFDDVVAITPNTTHHVLGYFEESNYEGTRERFLKSISYPVGSMENSYSKNIVKENDIPIRFGYIYKVDPLSIELDSDEYKELMFLIEEAKIPLIFKRLMEIYMELSEKQKRMEYR